VYEEVKKLQTRVTSLEAELKSAKVSPTSPSVAVPTSVNVPSVERYFPLQIFLEIPWLTSIL
jgi:hypothetical protein